MSIENARVNHQADLPMPPGESGERQSVERIQKKVRDRVSDMQKFLESLGTMAARFVNLLIRMNVKAINSAPVRTLQNTQNPSLTDQPESRHWPPFEQPPTLRPTTPEPTRIIPELAPEQPPTLKPTTPEPTRIIPELAPEPPPSSSLRESIEKLHGGDTAIFRESLWIRDNFGVWHTQNEDEVLRRTVHNNDDMQNHINGGEAVRVAASDKSLIEQATKTRSMLNMTVFAEPVNGIQYEWRCKDQPFKFAKLDTVLHNPSFIVNVNDNAGHLFRLNHPGNWKSPVTLENGLQLGGMNVKMRDEKRHITFERTVNGFNVFAEEGASGTYTIKLWGRETRLDIRNAKPSIKPASPEVAVEQSREEISNVYPVQQGGYTSFFIQPSDRTLRARAPGGGPSGDVPPIPEGQNSVSVTIGDLTFQRSRHLHGRDRIAVTVALRAPVGQWQLDISARTGATMDVVSRQAPAATIQWQEASSRPPEAAPALPEWIAPNAVRLNPAEYERDVRAGDFCFVFEAGKIRVLRKVGEGGTVRGWQDVTNTNAIIADHDFVRQHGLAYFDGSLAGNILSPQAGATITAKKTGERWEFRNFRIVGGGTDVRWGRTSW